MQHSLNEGSRRWCSLSPLPGLVLQETDVSPAQIESNLAKTTMQAFSLIRAIVDLESGGSEA